MAEEKKQVYRQACWAVDEPFLAWLRTHYAALAANRLPVPSHVHHIPHYLAYLRRQGKVKKLALLVLDCLSLADWSIIQAAWGRRHAQWQFQVELYMAQIPTITQISRYALISGRRPENESASLENLPPESRAWNLFWTNKGAPQATVVCKAIALEREEIPVEVENPHARNCVLDR